MSKVEQLSDGGTRRKGFNVHPRLDYIFIVDYGQPDKTKSGLYLSDSDSHFWRYKHDEWRYGEVVAVGPGRWSKAGHERSGMPDLKVGDKVMFSRKSGTRLPKYQYSMRSMHYPDAGELNVRILDPVKIAGKVNDFEPWWDIGEAQLNPSGTMSG